MHEFICPSCGVALERRRHSWGVFWECVSCGGRSSTISLMRKMVPRHIVNEIWQSVRNIDYPEVRDCSCCPARMEQVPVNMPSGELLLDVCPKCQFVWFDAGEHAQLPLDESSMQDEYELPPAAELEPGDWRKIQLEARARAEQTVEGPDELWLYIPAFMGMPIEADSDAKPVHAWMTWVIGLGMVVVSWFGFRSLQSSADAYGMIPARLGRLGGLTLITSFFLHAGPMHLLGNLYYLLFFGDNVEAVLGKFKFLMLLLLATVVGGMAQYMGDPSSTVPCIGASGGVSGILAFYALAFPRARLSIFVWLWFRPGWARMPALGFFAFWIALQLFGAFRQVDGMESVSYLAHLGGVATGVVFGAVWRLYGTLKPVELVTT